MNKKTVALTTEQYKEIITTMQSGFSGFRPNPRIAMALQLEANLGLRISDIVKLTDIDKTTLTNLEQDQCAVHGLLYNEYEHKNKHVTIVGWTYVHSNPKQ